MKVVINSCFGGFSISKKAAEFMAELGNEQAKSELKEYNKTNEYLQYFIKNGKHHPDCDKKLHDGIEITAKYSKEESWYGYGYTDDFENGYSRTDDDLVKAVEKLGYSASGLCASLKVVEIPDGIEYSIDEYDGMETIREKHKTWS